LYNILSDFEILKTKLGQLKCLSMRCLELVVSFYFMSLWYDDQDWVFYFVWKDAEWNVTVVEELDLDGKP
jgi:hypothetical protein